MMIIERPTITARITGTSKWVFVYGRRKTGKTFLVTRFVPHDEYFFVKTNKSVLSGDGHPVSLDAFMEIVRRAIDQGKTIVFDEFHRLGDDFLDVLHASPKHGKLILVSSTLHVSRKILGGHSPLLGLVAEIPVGLVSMQDALRALATRPDLAATKRERLELAIILKEPLAIDYLAGAAGRTPRDILAGIVAMSARTIPALTGEIFSEEERMLSGVYEGILRAVATGNVSSGAISSALFSKRLIKKDDPSLIQQYLANLLRFGILSRIEVFNKRKFIYKIPSPLSRIYYHADEKYNAGERTLNERELSTIIDEIMPRIVEDAVREAIASMLGLRESVVEAADHDVDGCLLRFKKPAVIVEVKWGQADARDVSRAERTFSKVEAPRRILFVHDKTTVPASASFETWDVDDLASGPAT